MKIRKKIAVVIGQINKIGGVGIAAVSEVRELRKLGMDAELVVLKRRNDFDYKSAFQTDDIPVVFLTDSLPKFIGVDFKIPFFSFFSFFHLSSILWAPALIKKRGYNFILVHETYNCFSAIACAKRAKAKLLCYIWDPVSYIVPRIYGKKIPKLIFPLAMVLARIIDKYILKNCDVVLAGSNLHKDLFYSLDPRVKITILPAGTAILPRLPSGRKRLIVSLTKWDRGKNPDFLLKIGLKLNGKFKFIIAGNWIDQKQKEAFEQKIGKMGLNRKIYVVGSVTEEEKFKLFSQARVLVHPIIEAFGMMALEAAGCGCPFIIPKGSGVTELFINNEHGFFPEEGDLNSFVKKTDFLLNDEKTSLLMGRKAYNQAINYSWESHAKKIKKIMEEVMDNEKS